MARLPGYEALGPRLRSLVGGDICLNNTNVCSRILDVANLDDLKTYFPTGAHRTPKFTSLYEASYLIRCLIQYIIIFSVWILIMSVKLAAVNGKYGNIPSRTVAPIKCFHRNKLIGVKKNLIPL